MNLLNGSGINKRKGKENEKNKKTIETCTKCMEKRLPEYNMGFNKHLWEETANKKQSTDI